MQRLDKTVYKDLPQSVLDNGDICQKPDFYGTPTNKLLQMYTSEESFFLFLFQGTSSIEYRQKHKSPELIRRVTIDLPPPIFTFVDNSTVFMLHPDRKLSVIQILKQGTNKDYIYNTPYNFFPSSDFLKARYLVGWNEYIVVFSYSKMMVINRLESTKAITAYPLSCTIITAINPDESYGAGTKVFLVNALPDNILFQQIDVSNGTLIKNGNIPNEYKGQLYVSVAHNDRDVAVAYTNHVYLYSLTEENKSITPVILPFVVIPHPHAAISKIYLDNYFLVVGDVYGSVMVFTSSGTFLMRVAGEDEAKQTDKKGVYKHRVTAITRFNLFVVVGCADGRVRFFTWDFRHSVLEKKECSGPVLRVFPHPDVNRVVILTENGSEKHIVGLTYWAPMDKSVDFISPQLAFSPELRYVSFCKPFVEQMRDFISVNFPEKSVGFSRNLPRFVTLLNFVHFLEEADNVHRMPFPIEPVFELTASMAAYCDLVAQIRAGQAESNYYTLMRAELEVLRKINVLCSIDTSTVTLKRQATFPDETFLSSMSRHFEKTLNAQMFKPVVGDADDTNYKNYLYKLLKQLFHEYFQVFNALESIDTLMTTIPNEDPFMTLNIIKVYGRYVQILQDVREVAWMIAQILKINDPNRWYYGGGLYHGRKLPSVCSDLENVPEEEFPLKMNN